MQQVRMSVLVGVFSALPLVLANTLLYFTVVGENLQEVMQSIINIFILSTLLSFLLFTALKALSFLRISIPLLAFSISITASSIMLYYGYPYLLIGNNLRSIIENYAGEFTSSLISPFLGGVIWGLTATITHKLLISRVFKKKLMILYIFLRARLQLMRKGKRRKLG